MNLLAIFFVTLLAVFTGFAPVLALESGDCLGCHSDADTVGATFVVNQAAFDTTAHAGIGCPTCHESVGPGHPDDGLAPSKAGCQDCHADIGEEYAGSSHHGQADCNDCHNPHQARGATAVSGHDMNQQCRLCHATDDVVAGHTAWLPQAELHIAALPCVSCHTAAKENVITLYVVKRQNGSRFDGLEPASYAELQRLANGKPVETLIDGNEDHYISLAELRLFNLDPKNTLRLQGMMTPERVTHDFRLLANRRDCSFCHASGPEARQTSFISLVQSDGRYQRVPVEKGAVLDALYGTPDFYMVGSTRSTALNYIGAMIIAGGLVMPIGHGTLRFLTRKNRQNEGRSSHE
jgi:predicted CXXCH cytochrome family protein